MIRQRASLRRLFVLLLSIVAAAAATAEAIAKPPGTPVSISIAPQSLASALQAFARQSGLQVGFESRLVKNLRTRGTKGVQTPQQALNRLLKGTNLEYRFIDDQTVVIKRKSSSPPTANMRPSDSPLTQSGDRSA